MEVPDMVNFVLFRQAKRSVGNAVLLKNSPGAFRFYPSINTKRHYFTSLSRSAHVNSLLSKCPVTS
jgi:hypothetical protein